MDPCRKAARKAKKAVKMTPTPEHNAKIAKLTLEELDNPLTQKVRYLDKLVDELAKGKAMEKILRK